MSFEGHADYRDWIREAYEARKVQMPGLSLEKVAKQVGLSKSYLSRVFGGERHLGLDGVMPLAGALEFDTYRTRILIAAVCSAQTTDTRLRFYFSQVVNALRFERKQLSEWPGFSKLARSDAPAQILDMLLLEVVRLRGAKTPDELADALSPVVRTGAAQVAKRVKALAQKGYLAPGEHGGFRKLKAIKFRVQADSISGLSWFSSSLSWIQASLTTLEAPAPTAHFMMAVAVDDARQREILELLGSVRDQLSGWAERPPEDARKVLWINSHLFCAAVSP